MRPPTILRAADEPDLPAIMAIFNLEIAESPYVYAEAPLTLDDRRSWLQMHRSASLPVVVATDPGSREVLGWASLSPYRAASGYRFTLEASVYVARGAHRRGIGTWVLIARRGPGCSITATRGRWRLTTTRSQARQPGRGTKSAGRCELATAPIHRASLRVRS